HPRTDRDNQPGILGDGNEIGWRNEAAGRVTPADQRLERADAVLLEVKQRLVVELELAALDRQPKVGLKLAADLRAFVEALLEERESAAAGLLGAVEGKIGAAEKHFAA